MDSSPSFPTYRSQNGGRHAHQTYDQYDYAEPSSDPPSDGSQQSDDPAVLVDLLANNYNLSLDLRSDLHSFLDVRVFFFLYLTFKSLVPDCALAPPYAAQDGSHPTGNNSLQSAALDRNQGAMFDNPRGCDENLQVPLRQCTDYQAPNGLVLPFHSLSLTLLQSEITAACKVLFYTGRRFNFSNEDFKADVIVRVFHLISKSIP
jgi:hypothetical protein